MNYRFLLPQGYEVPQQLVDHREKLAVRASAGQASFPERVFLASKPGGPA
jgi:hypothetical protein